MHAFKQRPSFCALHYYDMVQYSPAPIAAVADEEDLEEGGQTDFMPEKESTK